MTLKPIHELRIRHAKREENLIYCVVSSHVSRIEVFLKLSCGSVGSIRLEIGKSISISVQSEEEFHRTSCKEAGIKVSRYLKIELTRWGGIHASLISGGRCHQNVLGEILERGAR